jgi:hypothetical protein
MTPRFLRTGSGTEMGNSVDVVKSVGRDRRGVASSFAYAGCGTLDKQPLAVRCKSTTNVQVRESRTG